MKKYFRVSSFLKGVARTSDAFGSLDEYKYSDTPDSELLKQDWEVTWLDLRKELQRYEQNSSC